MDESPVKSTKVNCPCGRSIRYSACCERVHLNIHRAKTAEDLMRSRYSAFTLGDGEYLFKSHHSSQRNSADKKTTSIWAKSVQWMRLEVVSSTKGAFNSVYGTVAFKAFFIENGTLNVIEENATFERENGHWVYVGAV
ncbi:MAG: SEC-C motif-containing protein [Salibacteraceae bacterium]|jgi:SEC-C motif-containing protein